MALILTRPAWVLNKRCSSTNEKLDLSNYLNGVRVLSGSLPEVRVDKCNVLTDKAIGHLPLRSGANQCLNRTITEARNLIACINNV